MLMTAVLLLCVALGWMALSEPLRHDRDIRKRK